MSAKLCDYIVELRRQICPRTSYASSGKAGSELIIVAEDNDVNRAKNLFRSMSTEEFSELSYITSFTLRDDMSSWSNVVVLYNCMSEPLVNKCKLLLQANRVKLVIALKTAESVSEQDFGRFYCASSGISCSAYQKLDNHHATALFVARGQPSVSLQDDKGFNQQPSVQTLKQFRYLWAQQRMSDYNWGKERVLQRLADRALFNSSAKMTAEEWDDLIQKILAQGGNDRDVYSLVREKTLGNTLDADLAVKLNGSADTHKSAAGGAAGGDDEGGDGRALHMVSMTLECIPSSMQPAPFTYSIKSVLDYGCAEGAITAEIGKALKLPADRIYGADVRSIPSVGFTFLPLSAEKDNEIPALGSILPSLKDHSVDLITSAMVFHHVTHPAAILLELRRVISLSGVLIIREHHCTSADCGAFLDIIHGLYSLSWSSPVEWPDFLSEYKAFYRSREQWTLLIQSCGFVHIPNGSPKAARHYESAQASIMQRNGRIPNVTKAYYAVYAPDPRFRFPAPGTAVASINISSNSNMPGTGSGLDYTKRARDNSQDSNAKKPRVDDSSMATTSTNSSTVPPAPPSALPEGVFESKKYPGRYYRINATTGAAEWLEL